jgi:hypothetical protein
MFPRDSARSHSAAVQNHIPNPNHPSPVGLLQRIHPSAAVVFIRANRPDGHRKGRSEFSKRLHKSKCCARGLKIACSPRLSNTRAQFIWWESIPEGKAQSFLPTRCQQRSKRVETKWINATGRMQSVSYHFGSLRGSPRPTGSHGTAQLSSGIQNRCHVHSCQQEDSLREQQIWIFFSAK